MNTDDDSEELNHDKPIRPWEIGETGHGWMWQDRLRYRTAHRQIDMKLVSDLWPDLVSSTHISQAKPNLRKKYRRAVQTHKPHWVNLINEMIEIDKDNVEAMGLVADKLLENLHQTLPKVDGKLIVDSTEDVRKSKDIWKFHDSISIGMIFLVLSYSMMGKKELGDHDGVIARCNEMLCILPSPTIHDDGHFVIPHPSEISCLFSFGMSTGLTGNLEQGKKYLRCCAAAIRLIMYNEDNYSESDVDCMQGECKDVNAWIVKFMIMDKINKAEAVIERPLFDVPTINMYEKELGIGIYTSNGFRCEECGTARDVSKLELCGGCQRAWYCGKECQHANWHRVHKKHCKGKWRNDPIHFYMEDLEQVKQQINKNGGVYFYQERDRFALCCIDPATNEAFCGWTDRPVVF